MIFADLHLHSRESDGQFPPRKVAGLVSQAGLGGFSLTDHDTMSGLKDAAAKAHALGLAFISGVELSCQFRAREVHLLGYGIDPSDPRLTLKLGEMAAGRRDRAAKMVAKLNELGLPLDPAKLNQIAGHGTIGRPHLAMAMIEQGYVTSVKEAFALYLGKGRPAFFPRPKLEPGAAIELIRSAGGLPVLAHPGLVRDDSVIPALVELGLAGLEAAYPQHSAAEQHKYRSLCSRYHLLVTGGSDFHGPEIKDTPLAAAGVSRAEFEALTALKERNR